MLLPRSICLVLVCTFVATAAGCGDDNKPAASETRDFSDPTEIVGPTDLESRTFENEITPEESRRLRTVPKGDVTPKQAKSVKRNTPKEQLQEDFGKPLKVEQKGESVKVECWIYLLTNGTKYEYCFNDGLVTAHSPL
jgi:hypothetical protein